MADSAGKMQQVLELIAKFSLKTLDTEWIKSVIDADFTDVGDLPSDFEDCHYSTNLSGLFSAVNNSFRQWVDFIPQINDDSQRMSTSNLADDDDDENSVYTRFWTELSDDVKRLMTLLFYYCFQGQRYDAKEKERELGIHAASLYFLLLCVPGSNAFRVFHPVMYLKCVETMRLATKLQVGAASPKKGRGSSSGRGSQHRRHQEDPAGADVDEEDESEATILTPSEATKLVRSLNILLHDFLRLTQRFSLKHSPESLDETISVLIDVSRAETYNAHGIFVERHGPATITGLAYNSYVSLQSLCSAIHGQRQKIVLLIMKHILHNILMVPRGLSDLSGRALGVIRDHSQIFVKYLLMQVKEDAYDGVYILIQHLCLQVPDKADFRQKTAQSVVEILRFLPINLYVRLIKWFFKFSHNEKAGHRLFMLEVISKMLGEAERSAEGSCENTMDAAPPRRLSTVTEDQGHESSEDEQQHEGENSFCAVPVDHPVEIPPDRKLLSHKFLLSIIFSRCRDSGASVRSKALSLLAECTHSTNRTIMLAMRQIFVTNKPRMFTTAHIPNNNINLESPRQEEGEEEGLNFPNAGMVVAMLHRRALDDKVTVRKSALQVLENLMKLHSDMLSTQNLMVLGEHCRDPALLIRKQMVVSLTSLLEHYPEDKAIATTWIKAVLPLILDPEVKVQERVVLGLDQLLFQRLLKAGHPQEHLKDNRLPWHILSTLTKCSYHKFFNKALLHWSKLDGSRPQVVNIVKSHIGQEHNEEAWTLLAMLSGYITIKNVTFAVDYFEEHCQNPEEVGAYTLLQVLKVLSNSIKHVPGDRAEDLHRQLLLPISSFSVGVELISSMMDTVTLLTYSLHGDDVDGQKAIEKWVAPLLKACDEYLKQVLFDKADQLDTAGEERLFRHIFTMGEASMLCSQKVNKRMFLMLQSLIFHQQGQEGEECPSTMPSTQTQRSQPTTITFTPTVRLQALAVVTLGKMCLQHEDQAKRIIPALACMLTPATHPSIKNNILFTLADMCVRYATLVDPLMPQVTACLRDPDPQVHRTALTLLISLLQEDYLKLKGSFFYRILQCLTEKDEEMREMVVFYITERLLKRFPKILCQHFIECIFHYNCYEEHESYNRFSQSSLEKEVFSLAGREHSQERHAIYHFMLDHMPDDQRFMTTQRLCQDVLGAVVDGRIKLNKNSMPMLEDTLTILRSDEIKLASLKSRPEDTDQPTDQAEQAAMAGMVIKKTIISQVVKQNVIENIVPILIAVKHKLEEQRSPLMKHLLLYLKDLMKDYKNEVKEILAGDKQLAKEIEFDLRRFDKEQWEEKDRGKENDQRALRNNENDRDIIHDANPAAKEIGQREPREQDAERLPTADTATPVTMKDLHTRAQMFSKDATSRRKSIAAPSSLENKREPSKVMQAVVKLRRISIADFRGNPGDGGTSEREETSHVDARAIGGYPQEEEEEEEEIKRSEEEVENLEAEKDKNKQASGRNKMRLELLRAISTPSTEKTLISNLTFVNETQELSAINLDATESSSRGTTEELQLHPTSPAAFRKECEFSRLRRTSKELQKDSNKASKEKAKEKRPKVSGGLFESYEAENSQSEGESVGESDISTVSTKSAGKRVEGKRTRHMASLSPDPDKNKAAYTEKPKQKKHRKKT